MGIKRTQLRQARLAQIEVEIKQYYAWVDQQCFPIKLVLSTINSVVAGAYIGVCFDRYFKAGCPVELDPVQLSRFGRYRPLVNSFLAGPTLEQARNFTVMFAVNSSMSSVMEKLRGRFDIQSSLTAGFSTGVMLSLVTGMRGPEVMSLGVMFALTNGGLFKLEEKLAQQMAEDVLRDKPTDTLSSIGLGLNQHMMNVNTCFFTDKALLLLDRKEAKKECSRT